VELAFWLSYQEVKDHKKDTLYVHPTTRDHLWRERQGYVKVDSGENILHVLDAVGKGKPNAEGWYPLLIISY
jgi:hypothetical protein